VTFLTPARWRRTDRAPRRGAVVLALALPLVALSLVTPATSARAADPNWSGVAPVATTTPALAPGESSWLAVSWTTRATVIDWSTKVTAPAGVTVTYPQTRGGGDTSLYGSAVLARGTKDFTAFKLSVPHTQLTSFNVTVTSTFKGCHGLLTCTDQVLLSGTSTSLLALGVSTDTVTTTVTVPVAPAVGAPFTQTTTEVAVPAGGAAFQQVAFTGGQADLPAFSVQAGPLPAGLTVAYPGDGTASTLNGGSTLRGRTTDHVGLRFDVSGLQPGRYVVPLVVRYTALTPVTAPSEVLLVVS
jgi:hypothetical protein